VHDEAPASEGPLDDPECPPELVVVLLPEDVWDPELDEPPLDPDPGSLDAEPDPDAVDASSPEVSPPEPGSPPFVLLHPPSDATAEVTAKVTARATATDGIRCIRRLLPFGQGRA
jgi:hypothetical protein